MRERKTILILGIIAFVIVGAIVALAIFFHKKVETERNQARTAKAREARHRKPEEEQNAAGDKSPEQVAQEETPVTDEGNS